MTSLFGTEADKLDRAMLKLDLATRSRDPEVNIRALLDVSVAFQDMQNFEDSLKYAIEARACCNGSTNHIQLLPSIHFNIALSWYRLNFFDEALEHFVMALRYFEGASAQKHLSLYRGEFVPSSDPIVFSVYCHLCDIFERLGQRELAQHCYDWRLIHSSTDTSTPEYICTLQDLSKFNKGLNPELALEFTLAAEDLSRDVQSMSTCTTTTDEDSGVDAGQNIWDYM